uniref:Uncharacterized protein n=1 Tax=Anguilla anguilla TaxID=7936 RepID=A0A0E9UCB5_ANGAN
METRGKGTLG